MKSIKVNSLNVINVIFILFVAELFHTERSHVRNLRVLETVFYRPLLNNKHLPPEQIDLLFSNLEEMLVIHGAFNAKMKKRRKEDTVIGDIGELLLSMVSNFVFIILNLKIECIINRLAFFNCYFFIF